MTEYQLAGKSEPFAMGSHRADALASWKTKKQSEKSSNGRLFTDGTDAEETGL